MDDQSPFSASLPFFPTASLLARSYFPLLFFSRVEQIAFIWIQTMHCPRFDRFVNIYKNFAFFPSFFVVLLGPIQRFVSSRLPGWIVHGQEMLFERDKIRIRDCFSIEICLQFERKRQKINQRFFRRQANETVFKQFAGYWLNSSLRNLFWFAPAGCHSVELQMEIIAATALLETGRNHINSVTDDRLSRCSQSAFRASRSW